MSEIALYHENIDDSGIPQKSLFGKIFRFFVKIIHFLVSLLLIPGVFIIMAADFVFLFVKYFFKGRNPGSFSRKK